MISILQSNPDTVRKKLDDGVRQPQNSSINQRNYRKKLDDGVQLISAITGKSLTMVSVNPSRPELRHRHLPLIGPPFPGQHLPRPALPREHRAILHISLMISNNPLNPGHRSTWGGERMR
jgi:hypothetical protein